MALIHGYIDKSTGNIGYQGDLQVAADGTYKDESLVRLGKPVGPARWQQVQVLEGHVTDLVFVRIGRHSFEYLERISPEGRPGYIADYPGLCSDRFTQRLRQDA